METNNLIQDLSKLTTISTETLDKLFEKIYYIISDNIVEAMIKEKDVTEVDIGIGTLIIRICGDDIKFKFIPNAKLQEVVKTTIVTKENKLTSVVEKVLVERITNTYKDLLR